MRPIDFVEENNWLGGYYELAMRLGPRGAIDADDRLRRAMTVVWSTTELSGPVADRRTAFEAQQPVDLASVELTEPGSQYGLARLPGGATTACLTTTVREDGDGGRDWFDLCLPTGALGQVDHRVGAYPFNEEATSRGWREPIDLWLADIAGAVAQAAGLELALIGFEVSGQDWLVVDGAPPPERWISYLFPTAGGVERFGPSHWD